VQLVFILKLFGARLVQHELASLFKQHIRTEDYLALAGRFQDGVKAATANDPEAVAQMVTDVLFSIH